MNEEERCHTIGRRSTQLSQLNVCTNKHDHVTNTRAGTHPHNNNSNSCYIHTEKFESIINPHQIPPSAEERCGEWL